jgi:nitrite reductase (NO-forming)
MTDGTTAMDLHPSWWARHIHPLNSFLRILMGIVWLSDGFLKFYSGFAGSFLSTLQDQQSSNPSWLSGWFQFWINVTGSNQVAVVYTVGFFELALGAALVLGFMRKLAYTGGVVLALLIWSIAEGFGGIFTPITPASTDIGTGIMYAFALFGLILINAAHGVSRYSIDYYIERAFPGWARVAEFGTPVIGPISGSTAAPKAPS